VTSWLALGISLVAIAVALVVMRRMIDKRAGSAAVLDEIKREVGAILTELNQTTERNIELIEDRIAELQKLIEQADRRLTTLRREYRRSEASDVTYSKLKPRSVPSIGPEPEPETAKREEDRAAGGARSEEPQRAGNKGSEPLATAAGLQESGEPGGQSGSPEPVPVRERVLQLYRQGVSVERIASRLKTTIAEVELIVSLNER
jgi:transposase